MLIEFIQQPDIVLFGIRIQEPVTTLSDLLISIACFYAYALVKKRTKPMRVNLYMQYYFLLMGIATLWGGFFGHGFAYVVGFYGRMPGWYLSMLSIMFFERASIEHARPYIKESLIKYLLIINILELILMATLTTITLDFIYVQAHSVYGVLFVVFSFQLYTFIKSKDKGSKIALYGVAIVSVAAIIYNYPLIISKWFNHLDFAHLLMAIATFVFLKACLNFKENSLKSNSE